MKKRGQFYLVAAIIIIIAIIGIATVRNYVITKPTETIVYDLKEFYDLETGRVIDSADLSNQNPTILIQEWTETIVAANSGVGIDNWIFIYVNKTGVYAIEYANDDTGTISLLGGTFTLVQRQITTIPIDRNKVTFTLNNATYIYNVKNDEQMIILISKDNTVAG